ncbi:MAG: polysaccharide biosynthesis protein [Candidatus Hydrogenedentota bacterium]|nr:MAG: polysaccharide biosynthesis protein [Candidatus Hydrogenedentota bacterium]
MRRFWFYVADAASVFLAIFLAALVRFGSAIPAVEVSILLRAAFVMTAARLVGFGLFQCDRWSFRYAGASELRRLLAALSLGSLIGWAVIYLAGPEGTSRAVLLLEPIFTLFLTGAYRFALRVLPEHRRERRGGRLEKGRRVLLVGAGEAGVMTLREIRNHPESDMNVVGFIDDDPGKHGLWIDGVRVIGGRNEIPRAVEALDVEEIILAIPSATGDQMRSLVAACREVRTRFRIVPGLLSIIRGDVPFERIRRIEPEDLLGRETLEIDPRRFADRLRGETVLVTGAAGSIGSEICRQVADAGARVILLDHSESGLFEIDGILRASRPETPPLVFVADIRNRERLEAVFRQTQPRIVFHAAACKHVPMMETNITEAVSTNILGTRNVLEVAESSGTERFVLISTDKAVRPTSVMGATKRFAEEILVAHDGRIVRAAVRFGNVFGSSGSVVPLFRKQIEHRGPVTVTHPHVIRYFMTIPEAVHLVLEASFLARKTDLFVLEMGQPVRILDLARNMITLAGLRPDIDVPIVFTGLRPGEKLVEEVLTEGENIVPTEARKVFRVRGTGRPNPEVFRVVEDLEKRLYEATAEEIRRMLKRVVSEYEPEGPRRDSLSRDSREGARDDREGAGEEKGGAGSG